MKIQGINLYNNFNANQSRPLKITSYPAFKGQDNVERPQKESLLDKIKSAFKRPIIPQIACYTPRKDQSNLNDEELYSEKIKHFTGETVASYAKFKKIGKENHKELKTMLSVGKRNGFRGTIRYDDTKTIIFNKIDENLGIPSSISVWENGKFVYSYKIKENNPELKYHLFEVNGDITTEYEGIGDKINSLIQYDKASSIIKQIDETEAGFNYLYGIKDKNSDNIQILKRLYFDFENIEGCIYGEGQENSVALFMYDAKNDLWENRYIIDIDGEINQNAP